MKSGNFLRVLAVIYLYFGLLSSGDLYSRTCDIYKGDTLTIQIGTRILSIHRHKVNRLEVARVGKRHTAEGTVIGALTGGMGMGLGLAVAVLLSDIGFGPSPGEALLLGTVFGAPLVRFTGTIIGSGSESFHWVNVPVEAISVKEKAVALPARPDEKLTKATRQKQNAPHQRRWSISINLGISSRGPHAGIEKAMIRDGFNETLPEGWLGGPVEYPSFDPGFGELGVPWSLELTYSLNRRLEGALLFSNVPVGTTRGYRTGPEIFLDLNYYSTIISPVIILKSLNILQLGMGPAWFINKIEQESVSKIIYREQKGRAGAVLMATLTYPNRTRFFIKLDGQFRWTPGATFGPFKDTYRGTSLAQLQPFEANFSHAFVDFGFGMRF